MVSMSDRDAKALCFLKPFDGQSGNNNSVVYNMPNTVYISSSLGHSVNDGKNRFGVWLSG